MRRFKDQSLCNSCAFQCLVPDAQANAVAMKHAQLCMHCAGHRTHNTLAMGGRPRRSDDGLLLQVSAAVDVDRRAQDPEAPP